MLSYIWSRALSTLLARLVVSVAPFLSTSVFAAKLADSSWASALHIPAEVRQETTPVQQLDLYLAGFHLDPNHPAVQDAAHYYCQQLTAELAQCPIYGDNGRDARLIGVEYIISSRLFHSLAADEQQLWHPHVYEVQAGLLTAPGLPPEIEHALMEHLASTYGKTWYLWQGKEQSLPVGHASDVPIGRASLMQSPTKEGQIDPALVEERDRRFNVALDTLQQQRADITPIDARAPQEQRIARADSQTPLEPPPPPFPSSPSDLPKPTDPEPEPYANIPGPEAPPSVQPAPMKPGLPPPPMPQPAEPPLSQRPALNPSVPSAPEQQPAPPSPTPKPETTVYEETPNK